MPKYYSLTFLFFVLMYLLSLPFVVDFLWLLKIIPIAVLGVAVLNSECGSIRPILLLALVFSGCGDLLLAFDLFIFGVAAFLIAQLSYAALFMYSWQGILKRWPLSVVLIIYMLLMACWLLPNLGELQLPVMAYLFAIGIMGLLAVQSSLPMRWAGVGAIFFIISDSLIAINKFINPILLESVWIMSTYYAAQFMLVTGFLSSTMNKDKAALNPI